MLGELGGFNDIIFKIISLFVTSYAGEAYLSDLVNYK
jgi:hypothetical protein